MNSENSKNRREYLTEYRYFLDYGTKVYNRSKHFEQIKLYFAVKFDISRNVPIFLENPNFKTSLDAIKFQLSDTWNRNLNPKKLFTMLKSNRRLKDCKRDPGFNLLNESLALSDSFISPTGQEITFHIKDTREYLKKKTITETLQIYEKDSALHCTVGLKDIFFGDFAEIILQRSILLYNIASKRGISPGTLRFSVENMKLKVDGVGDLMQKKEEALSILKNISKEYTPETLPTLKGYLK